MEIIKRFLENNPEDVLPVDQDGVEDIQQCATYVKDIYVNLLEQETKVALPPNFITRQRVLAADDRTILLDWISRAHSKFNLANESFFHTMSVFDYLCAKIIINPYDSRLIAVTCLQIASKYEQSYIPSLRHYIDILYGEQGCRYVNCPECQKYIEQKYGITNYRQYGDICCYSDTPEEVLQKQNQLEPCKKCIRNAIIQAEEEILSALGFFLAFPNPLVFLRRYAKISNMKPRDRYISFYLAELCCLNAEIIAKYTPSLIAAGCIAMTRRLTRKTSWSPELERYSGYTEAGIKDMLQDVSLTLKLLALSPKVKNVKQKYANTERFYGVSKLIENVVQQVVGQK